MSKPAPIPARPKSAVTNTRSWPWSSNEKQNSLVVRRKAWFLMSCVCCEMTDDNLEMLRHKLAVCQAVKTEVKLTSSMLSWGRRGRGQRIKRTRIPLNNVQSIEQDEVFVNVMLCVFRLVDMPEHINYQIAAFKFHDTADVRAIVLTFQNWTGAGPMEKTPSVINGTMLMKSVGGGSVHSLAMPGRPTSAVLAPDRWVAVDRSLPRRYGSQSVGDLTATSDVFYSTTGSRPVNGGSILRTNGNVNGGYRYRSSGNEHHTMTSDEGNGSLSFSDQQLQANNGRQVRATIRSDASSSEPISPDDQPTPRNGRGDGIASVQTGGGGNDYGLTMVSQSTRLTRSVGHFDDEDDMSTVSGVSSAFEEEPALSSRYRGASTNGHYSNENRIMRRSLNDIIDDEVDTYRGGRGVEPLHVNGAIANKSSNVRRVHSRPVYYSESEIGVATNGNADVTGRRSRITSREFHQQQRHIPSARSRSAGPLQQHRYSRSDFENDTMSIAASNLSVSRHQQATALINPNFEKRYAARQQSAPTGNSSLYRQAARPAYVPMSGSTYGGVRSRAMSHRIR